MILTLIGAALAAPTLDATVRAGARSAPESALPLPSLWEAEIEPAGLLSADLRGQVGQDSGPTAWLTLGGWGYAPDGEASLATAGLGAGWRQKKDDISWSAAARYDGQLFPVLWAASNGRAELFGDLGRSFGKSQLTGSLTALDRRFVGDAAYSTAELAGLFSHSAQAWGVDLGASAQGNAAPGGEPGAQLRSRARLRLGGERWRLSLEHQLILAFGGEVESELRPVFTPVGDYAGDVDALSGGGFSQHRLALSGTLLQGPWLLSVGAMGRLRRPAFEEEAAFSYVEAASGQLRAQRDLKKGMDVFAVVGLAGASLGDGTGFVDSFGWLGFDLRWPRP